MLLALSWEFPKLIFLFILLLSIFCPLIHENNTNSLLCAAANSAQSLLASWPNSLRFANKHTSCTLLLILPLFVFPLCACTYLVRGLLLVLQCQSGPLALAKLGHQKHSQILDLWNLTPSSSPAECACECVCVHMHACMCACLHALMYPH